MTLVCWNCGHDLSDVPRPISRHEQCQQCFEPLHCCRLCRYYEPEAPGQCLHERADPPQNKENANFCEYYTPVANRFTEARGSQASSARQALDSLFGGNKKPAERVGDSAAEGELDNSKPASEQEAARTKLDDLFNS